MPSPFTRKVTTSHGLAARLSPSNRRRDAMPHSRLPPSAADQEEGQAALLLSNLPPPPSNAQPPSISRAILFLIGFSTLTFASAAYYSLRETEHIASQLGSSRDVFSNISSYLTSSSSSSTSSSGNVWGPGITDQKLSSAHAHDTATKLGLRMQSLLGWCEQLHFPAALTEFIGRTYIIVAEGYLELPPCKQAVVPIVAVNSAVFAAWSIASFRQGAGGRMYKWMTTHFVHRPCSNRLHTMVSSVYSHQAPLHLVFNNIALWSISSSALILASTRYAYTNSRIAESWPTPHFLAFFTSAGLFASTVSHIVSAIQFKRLSCLLSLPIAKAMVGRQASLGASGAVYACLIMSACAFPQAQLGIIFLPFVTVPIGVGVAGLVAADVVGVLRGWRVFDHWAHLGGAAFGGLYWYGDGVRAWEGLKKWLVERVGFGSGQRERGVECRV
ncbi:related to PCP1-mitochondrial serine protease [Ustilago bromivora]|uniref:Related to PCP1-mitochondrial serine protease n=2 Tax=Ustilago bromivora TaxID=307758 RepID=A0A1K0H9V6_9BASI|nr:related to PCP1-mitochondrial serine protease [Ustilago bromivora]